MIFRLPIFQGTSFAFLPPVLAILNLPHNQCPDPLPPGFMNSTTTLYNDTDGSIVDGEELWQRRIREVIFFKCCDFVRVFNLFLTRLLQIG